MYRDRRVSLDWVRRRAALRGERALRMKPIEWFAFVILPTQLGVSVWGAILINDRVNRRRQPHASVGPSDQDREQRRTGNDDPLAP